MVPMDHMRTMVRTDYNYFNSLHCFNYSIATIAPAISEPDKPLKLVVSKKKDAYKTNVASAYLFENYQSFYIQP